MGTGSAGFGLWGIGCGSNLCTMPPKFSFFVTKKLKVVKLHTVFCDISKVTGVPRFRVQKTPPKGPTPVRSDE
eukprot:3213413-Rhodomonas_salina.1